MYGNLQNVMKLNNRDYDNKCLGINFQDNLLYYASVPIAIKVISQYNIKDDAVSNLISDRSIHYTPT